MTSIKRADKHINGFDLMFLIMTNTLGVVLLTLPRMIAGKTIAADGWVGIIVGGTIACLFAWLLAKLVSKFEGQSFLSYTANLLSKPVAIVISFVFLLQYLLLASYNARFLTEVSRQYFFHRTPIEVICIVFLLVVIYAASGLRVGIFRLNFMFLPIFFVVATIIFILTLGLIEKKNMLPFLQTDLMGHLDATMISFQALLGFGIVLFYISLVDKVEKTPKITAIGVLSAMIIYLITYIICIGVFGDITTFNIIFPTLEVTKSIYIPGGFMAGFDLVVFSVWIMTVFISCLVAFDIAVHLVQLMFSKISKISIICILAPIIYMLSMLPKDYLELIALKKYINYFIPAYLIIVFILLSVAYKMKGLKHVG